MALPAPTASTATKRYIPAGVRRFVWVPTIADINAPAIAELSAGTDLTAEIPPDGVAGFDVSSASVETGDYGSTFTSKIPGLESSSDSSIKTYLSSDSTDSRTLLTEGLNGFVAIFPEGIVTTGTVSVFPVRVGSSNIDEVAAGDPATLTTMFSITARPAVNVAIPSV